jgi:pimeloyl-ACP methyl ester carboxylesterase
VRVDIGGGVRLFVDVLGPGLVPTDKAMEPLPALLMLHGGPGLDHSLYRPLFDQLTDVAQVILYDHRGNGRSDGRDSPSAWTLDMWADDVVRLCDALGVEQPIVFGNSFGGVVAMHYAARHPQHPSGLVIGSATTHLDLDLIAGWFGRLGGPDAEAAARRFWTAPDDEVTAAYLSICGPLYTRNKGNLFDEARSMRNPEVMNHYVRNIQPSLDLRPGLANIACPTLLLAGGQDPVCPVEIMREMAALVPPDHAQLHVLDRCGHGVFRDDPERAFALLRAFIAARTSVQTP